MKTIFKWWLIAIGCIFAVTVSSCSATDEWDEFNGLESDSEISLKFIKPTCFEIYDEEYTLGFFDNIPDHGKYIACITDNDIVKEFNAFLDKRNNGYEYDSFHLPYIDPANETIIMTKINTVTPFSMIVSDLLSYKCVEKNNEMYFMQYFEASTLIAVPCKIFKPVDHEQIYFVIINRPNIESSKIKLDMKLNSHPLLSDFGIDNNLVTANNRKYRTLKCTECTNHRE